MFGVVCSDMIICNVQHSTLIVEQRCCKMLWTAFVLGFIGSLHCLGMCGPIVLVLPRDAQSRTLFFLGRLAYTFGKAVTYGAMGLVVGLLGQAIFLAGYQQLLGIITGALMILSALLPGKILSRLLPARGRTAATNVVKQSLGKLLSRGSSASLFVIGLLNGFLPCGLVYTALAGAMAGGSSVSGAAFMRFLPIGVILLGLFFILRGASLGIPYLSPKMNAMHRHAAGRTVQMPADSGCCSHHSEH